MNEAMPPSYVDQPCHPMQMIKRHMIQTQLSPRTAIDEKKRRKIEASIQKSDNGTITKNRYHLAFLERTVNAGVEIKSYIRKWDSRSKVRILTVGKQSRFVRSIPTFKSWQKPEYSLSPPGNHALEQCEVAIGIDINLPSGSSLTALTLEAANSLLSPLGSHLRELLRLWMKGN
ncbi:4''-phosphopantetheinyl transferase [Trichophyton benhamiae CBS 112371]|uniref:4''-phosphopantetheinyl transferase n=1 Tax=Arthroderma benhamiae (strain ATCC MYA-4681 / CBS 112371) TaxID=663331 RepID=D4AIF3_ARTBC|nr:4''-phosphopantetheinyl transferase [Trichophyton benhamiae CBS 112371]EFE36526.1 4''-phosphopantetheinyl transferase [Trichophyton benhamiae CBS 112371]